MGRLIDADVVEDTLRNYANKVSSESAIGLNLAVLKLRNIPTAYDVDAMVEELKTYQNQHNAMCEQHKVKTIEDIYNKAVDDFAERLKPIIDEKIKGCTNSDILRIWCENSINNVAEKLKKEM